MKPSPKTLSKLKQDVYLNAFRLFSDACLLYENNAYPSSFALAILSLEELGKLEMIDHICDDIILNPDHDPQGFLNHLFSRGMFYSHKNKQAWASLDATSKKTYEKRFRDISDGHLEKTKQKAFYVGYKNRINNPNKITSRQALKEIKIVHNKFIDLKDLGFNGFYCEETEESIKEAKKYLLQVKNKFRKIKSIAKN